MKKAIILIIVAVILVFTVAGLLWFFVFNQNKQENGPDNLTEGIIITSPRPVEPVKFPLKIAGKINGGGWIGFEGSVGTVKLVTAQNNILAEAALMATTDWKQKEVSFEVELNSTDNYQGPAMLFFSNENPSGEEANKREIAWPVFIR